MRVQSAGYGSVLELGGIFCWAVAIGSEYAIQKWPRAKKTLNRLAMLFFFLALCAEFGAYRYEERAEIQWFQATDGNMSRSLF